eukprot:TRINITY_DN20_c0_g2_i1.p1 TRINITY_DN20_c0_g2~~TRINITY_DN20_c0_g2_i1.p1  ORF type:complete len:747 (-),score=161.40 TRINITY_DN20_c0_g2_i1:93-2333(-)
MESATNQSTEPKRVCVFTSGGDSQGMNAAVRAIVRIGCARGAEVFVAYEGYIGLVNGGDMIKKMESRDVSRIIHLGGTCIGSARCAEFRTFEGRLKAAYNLVSRGIDALIVIGGDGSLTGADKFREEWKLLLQTLVDQQKIDAQTAEKYNHLSITGLAGSIDNDMAGTDFTIGTDSALQLIVKACDALVSTASSHQRTFVVEVMGRNCGYLALMAGIATGADFILIPECPPDVEDWREKLCYILSRSRSHGRRYGLIIVSEGAKDRDGKKITAEEIKDAVESKLKFETRITILGHVQRGGSPTAFDRNLATSMGAEAIECALTADANTPATFIGINEVNIVRKPLMECVQKTLAVPKAVEAKEFEKAIQLRGGDFEEAFETFRMFRRPEPFEKPSDDSKRFAIVCTGAPAAGMNPAIRAAALYARNFGDCAYGVDEGFEGLTKGQIRPLTWEEVNPWIFEGGCNLGTNRSQPTEETLPLIAAALKEHKIDGLIIIGGFEAFTNISILEKARDKYDALRIPMVCIPATISNNVPGTQYSLGCDTALNVIVEAGDRIKQSGHASRHRLFLLEVQGGKCGYLATVGAIAMGAEDALTPEQPLTLEVIKKQVDFIKHRFQTGHTSGLLVITDGCSSTYTTGVLESVFSAEGKGTFECRQCILGHVQQGGPPTPIDRIRGTRLAWKSVQFLKDQIAQGKGSESVSACIVGFDGNILKFRPVCELVDEADFKNRRQKHPWWLKSHALLQNLA